MMMSIQKVHIIRPIQRLKAFRRAPPAFTKNYLEEEPAEAEKAISPFSNCHPSVISVDYFTNLQTNTFISVTVSVKRAYGSGKLRSQGAGITYIIG